MLFPLPVAISGRLNDRTLLLVLGSMLIFTVIFISWTRDESVKIGVAPVPKLTISDLACFGKDSKRIENSLKASEVIYQTSIKKRQAIVNDQPDKIEPWKPHTYAFDYFLATFSCPFTTQRIGKLGDGGKWVCGMELLEKKSSCVIYSFGISGETSFEQEMLERTKCELFGYDASVSGISASQDYGKRVHFNKLWGGDEVSETTTTIGEAMRKNGHTKIDLLKVDIEGSEFKLLKQVIDEFGDELPFTQLLLEIHMNTFTSLYEFFNILERAGLRPVRNELNISPIVTDRSKPLKPSLALSEYSFLYAKRLC